RLDDLPALAVVEQVGLGQRDDLRLVSQSRAVAVELAANDPPPLERVLGRAIDEVEQQPCAFDVAEEAIADTGTFGCALDQARNIGDDELAPLVADDSELWAQCRERVVADLGASVADRVEKGRLAGVGKADQADVGEQLEPQPHPHLFAGFTGLMLARGAVGRALVAGVAAPAHSALQLHDSLADLGQVGEEGAILVIGKDLSPDWHLDHEILSAGSGAVGTRAALSARRTEMLGVAEVDQRIEPGNGLEDHVGALAAIAAVGPAELDELLAPEAHRAGTARAGADEDLGLVEEMHLPRGLRDADARGNRAAACR